MPYCEIKGELLLSEQRIYFAADEKEYSNIMVNNLFFCSLLKINRTVESFERKLEESQRALGIAPRDFIPVIYVNETSWAQELSRLAVCLLGSSLSLSSFFIILL